MKRIIIAVPALHEYDAVGTDVLMQHEALNQRFGESCIIFAKFVDDKLKGKVASLNLFLELIRSEDVILLYHHCVFWPEIDEYFRIARCTIILRYHNITPEHFFAGIDEVAIASTKLGREQTKRLVAGGRCRLYLGASQFNCDELIELGARRADCEVLAPFTLIRSFAELAQSPAQAQSSIQTKEGKALSLLFVGRVVPNKGHLHLIETLERYIHLFDEDVRLRVIGSCAPGLVRYFQVLEQRIQVAGLADYIEFTGKIDLAGLVRAYLEADVFLCLSEHEGFCVPLLEAQASSLPILALGQSAVPDTLGKDQLSFPEIDATLFAVALRRLKSDGELRAKLIAAGHQNLQRFALERLTTALGKTLSALM